MNIVIIAIVSVGIVLTSIVGIVFLQNDSESLEITNILKTGNAPFWIAVYGNP